MKILIGLTLICFSIQSFSQELHHQMISSQGSSAVTSSGLIVNQTIGQQSVSGNSQSKIIVLQGFQQSYWRELMEGSNESGIAITVFPNPFLEDINFQFSNPVDSTVHISIFDLYGRVVFEKNSTVDNKLLKLADLAFLQHAQYLVRLSGKNFNYFTKIIKI